MLAHLTTEHTMHSYSISDIVARLRMPILVQLLIAANDIAYKLMQRDAKSQGVFYAINNALDAAIAHYARTGRIVISDNAQFEQ